MSWLGLLQLVLRLGAALADIVRERQLLDAGAAQQAARSLAETARRLEIGDRVTAEIEAMSDNDLDAALRGDR
jgi:hypothetical protein